MTTRVVALPASDAASSNDAESDFRTAFHFAGTGMALVDLDGRYLRVNPALLRMTGYAEDELLRLRFRDITHPDDVEQDLESAARLLAGAIDSYATEKRYVRRDGSTVWVRLTTAVGRDALGSPRHFITQVQDIDDQRRAEAERRAAQAHLEAALAAQRAVEARLRAAMTGMLDSFFVLRAMRDAAGAVVDFTAMEMNDSARALLGVSTPDDAEDATRTATRTATLLDLVPSAGRAALRQIGQAVLARRRRYDGVHRAPTTPSAASGAEWVRVQAFPLDGEPDTLAVIVRDVSARERVEARLRDEANRDALTGLLNRRGFERAVRPVLAESAAAGRPDVLLYADLDGFKPINDTYGHGVGDEALRNVAAMLRQCVRAGDVVARLGGDEFAIYAPAAAEAPSRDAAALRARLAEAFAHDNARGAEAGRPYALAASVGIVTLAARETFDAALARADEALYAEKRKRAPR